MQQAQTGCGIRVLRMLYDTSDAAHLLDQSPERFRLFRATQRAGASTHSSPPPSFDDLLKYLLK